MTVESDTGLAVFELLTFPTQELEGSASIQIFRRLRPGARGLLRFYVVNLIQHMLVPAILEGVPGNRTWLAQESVDVAMLVSHGLLQAKPISPEQKKTFPPYDSFFTLTDVGRRVGRLTTTGQYMPKYLVDLGLRELTVDDVRDEGLGLHSSPA